MYVARKGDVNMSQEFTALIPQLAGQNWLVAGDLILDRYIYGRATRMSREAPIPVLELTRQEHIPGGAANPSATMTALGSRVNQIGVVGDDAEGDILLSLLASRGIGIGAILRRSGVSTVVKTRIMAQMGLRFPQQVARVDMISRAPLTPSEQTLVLAHVEEQLVVSRGILLSDYHISLLETSIVSNIRELAQRHGRLLVADTQGQLEKYAGFHTVKCNADDAQAYLRRALTSDADFAMAADQLYQDLRLNGTMIITRGAAGATIATADETVHIPSPTISDVYDTVGAGDTFIAVFALALGAGIARDVAARLANVASGVVVRHVGNYAPTAEDLTRALTR